MFPKQAFSLLIFAPCRHLSPSFLFASMPASFLPFFKTGSNLVAQFDLKLSVLLLPPYCLDYRQAMLYLSRGDILSLQENVLRQRERWLVEELESLKEKAGLSVLFRGRRVPFVLWIRRGRVDTYLGRFLELVKSRRQGTSCVILMTFQFLVKDQEYQLKGQGGTGKGMNKKQPVGE